MSIFKTADASSTYKKSDTENRIGVSIASGAFRPNTLLKEIIEKEGGQVKLHLLQENIGKIFSKGDLFLQVVADGGIQLKSYSGKEPQFQSRAAAELVVESIGRPIKSMNCKVASEPVFIGDVWVYALITAGATIKE